MRSAVLRGAEFFHDARAVHFDGAWRNAQFKPSFLVGLPVGDELQNFAFTRRELSKTTHFDRTPSPMHGAEMNVSPQAIPYGIEEMIGIDRLLQHVGCAHLHGSDRRFELGRFGEHEHGCSPMHGFDALEQR